MIVDDIARRYASWFSCLADPSRIRLLQAIGASAEPLTVGQLVRMTGMTQPTVSHHLQILAAERFVFCARRGTRTYCSVNPRCLDNFPAAARAVLGLDTVSGVASVGEVPGAGDGNSQPLDGVRLRRARSGDLPHLRALLDSHRLPLVGVEDNLAHTLVADRDGAVVGCAALEYHGRAALLRSVAVDNRLRGRGLGRRLVERLLGSVEPPVRRIVLLTETAPDFFARLNFRPIERRRVPAAVRASSEFTGACSLSAVAMTRLLPARGA